MLILADQADVAGPTTTSTSTSTTAATPTTAATTATTLAPSGSVGDKGVAAPVVGGLLLAAVVIGVALGYLIRSSRSPKPADAPASGVLGGSESELVSAVIDVRDRVDNKALADRLGAGLASAGWVTLDPVDERFDPALQNAVDREPAPSPDLDGKVAAVERVGYRDRSGTVLRPPDVVVYRYDGGSGAGR